MIESIYLIGIAQGLLLCLIFFKKGKEDSAFYWLSSLILANTLIILGQWLYATHLHFSLWLLYLISSGFIFVIGPLLYFFTKKKVFSAEIDLGKTGPHFIPVALYYFLIAFLAYPYTQLHLQDFLLDSTETSPNDGIPLFAILKLIHLFFYTVLAFRVVQKNQKPGLKPLWYFILGYIIIQGIAWVMLIASTIIKSNLLQLVDHILVLIIVFYLYILGYANMRKSIFLEGASLVTGKKYKTGGLNIESSRKIFDKLIYLMETEKPYLNPDLTLKKLADKLYVKPHHLSQVINENSGTNFSDFINSYRVENVKKYLSETRFQNFTILAVAYEAGFNNKNSFNIAFKKHTGKTPTAYRKDIFNQTSDAGAPKDPETNSG